MDSQSGIERDANGKWGRTLLIKVYVPICVCRCPFSKNTLSLFAKVYVPLTNKHHITVDNSYKLLYTVYSEGGIG